MRKKKVGLIVGWFAAASLAMLLASQAVAMVRDQVTDRPSRAATTLALETTTSTTTGSTPTTQPAATTSTSSDQEHTTTTIPGAPTTSTTTTTPEVTTTSAPTTSSTTSTTTATIPSNDEETFYLVGGWATVRCAGDDVALATYAPNLGYQVDIEANGPNEVEIKFEETAGDHRSKLEARCSSGVLQHQIDEDEDD